MGRVLTLEERQQNATISGDLEFALPKYVGKGDRCFTVSRRTQGGINVILPSGKDIEVSPDTIRAHKDGVSARYLVLQNGAKKPELRVVEHLISGIHGAGIHNATVRMNRATRFNFLPVMGPGVSDVYEKLLEEREVLPGRVPTFEVVSSYEVPLGIDKRGIQPHFRTEPADKLEIVIEKSTQPELAELGESPLEETDVYANFADYQFARPIARLTERWKYGINWLGNWTQRIRGVNPGSYILPSPNASADEIVSLMDEQYQEGRNEHLAHTLGSDFFGELHTFYPGVIQGRFILRDTNHITRVAALRDILKEGTIIKPQLDKAA